MNYIVLYLCIIGLFQLIAILIRCYQLDVRQYFRHIHKLRQENMTPMTDKEVEEMKIDIPWSISKHDEQELLKDRNI